MMQENVPIQLGQYKLGKTLGIGAFGKVKCKYGYILFMIKTEGPYCYSLYLVAHHVWTGLKVAVKILNKGKIKHMEMAEKVRREINILKMCTHPHICRL